MCAALPRDPDLQRCIITKDDDDGDDGNYVSDDDDDDAEGDDARGKLQYQMSNLICQLCPNLHFFVLNIVIILTRPWPAFSRRA